MGLTKAGRPKRTTSPSQAVLHGVGRGAWLRTGVAGVGCLRSERCFTLPHLQNATSCKTAEIEQGWSRQARDKEDRAWANTTAQPVLHYHVEHFPKREKIASAWEAQTHRHTARLQRVPARLQSSVWGWWLGAVCVRLFVCLFACLLVCLFARLLVCSFARLLVCSFASLLGWLVGWLVGWLGVSLAPATLQPRR